MSYLPSSIKYVAFAQLIAKAGGPHCYGTRSSSLWREFWEFSRPHRLLPHPLDIAAATLTCSFGPLAAGATASRTSWVVFNLPSAPTRVAATATRTASAPADLFPANDSSSVECWYSNHYPGFPPYPYRLFC